MKADYASIGMVVGALVIILQLANLAVGIWYRLRRKPPLDQELRQYVLKEDYNQFCQDTDRKLSNIYNLIRNQQSALSASVGELRRDLNEWQLGISKQIGNLEGMIRK